MAENTADKEALKAAKEAEKAAEKAKKERIKASKPKKEGNAFSRAGKGIKKFWKDFTGTCKKVVWPGPKQVFKSSCVVLASIIVVGLVIFGFDRGLTALFEQGASLSQNLGEKAANDATDAAVAEDTTETEETAEDESAAEEATAEEATAEEATAEETAAEETAAE